jgi:hypothetical protein
MNTTQKVKLAVILLAVVAGIISSLSVIGREARLVDVITLFAAGFAGGASLVSFLRKNPKTKAATAAKKSGTTATHPEKKVNRM